MFVSLRCLLATVPILWLAAGSLAGQSTFGSVAGVALDSAQGAVPGAQVTIRNLDENSTRETLTSSEGAFQFLNVKPGRYELTATKPNFAVFRIAGIQVDARETARAKVTFELETMQQSVLVEAAAPVVNTENGTIADTKDFSPDSASPIVLSAMGEPLFEAASAFSR